MSTATLDRPATLPRPARTGFRQSMSAEWTKMRTVRSTAWTLVSLVVASIGITALVSMMAAPDIADELAKSGSLDEPIGAFLTVGLFFSQVAALVLGVLVGSAEYTTGMVRATLTATPRRWTVLGAKTIVLGSLLLVLGAITALGSYAAGNFFFDQEGLGMSLSDDGVLRAIFGGGLYLAALALFGLAIGMLIRHTAGAVTVGIAIIFVLGNLVSLLPGSAGEWATKLMPANAGGALANVEQFNPDLLDPWVGYGVFAAQTALLLLLAGWLFNRRDA